MIDLDGTGQRLPSSVGSRRALLQSSIAVAGGFLVLRGGTQFTLTTATAQDDDGGDESGSGRGRGRGRGGEGDNRDQPADGDPQNAQSVGAVEVPAGSLEIRIVSEDASGFVPGELTVDVGQRVTFVNVSDDEHTATGSGFDTRAIDRGGMVTITLDEPGRFPYACQFHPVMTGRIAVRNAEGVVPERAGAAAPPGATTVSIVNLSFEPPLLDVQTGTTVAWSNDDAVPHTVTAADGSFDSGILDPGAGFSWTFSKPGSFPYICQLHPQMQATVDVTGDPAAAPTPGEATASPGASALQASTPGGEVSIVDFSFEPASLSIPVGGNVIWTNDGSAPHTVTGDFADSGVIDPGATFTHAFDAEGVFPYACAFHPDMTGQITVGPREATTSATPDTEVPSALPTAGMWLLNLQPDDETLIGPQRALVALDADGTAGADFAPVSPGADQVLPQGGLGTWFERDGGIELAFAMLTVDDSGRFAGHMTIDGTVSPDVAGDRLSGSFTFRHTSPAGDRVAEGSGSIAGERIPLVP